jgi:GrpB-like predicted nucleotidyltransferase (UPF0157 family)
LPEVLALGLDQEGHVAMPMILRIDPYDDLWPEEFLTIVTPIRAALGDLALRVDHIGSTSVPGLDAKDIIDIQVTVRELDHDLIVPPLGAVGYTLHPRIRSDHVPAGENPDPEEWAKLNFRPPAGQRPTHLHVRREGRANQRYALLFRDYLRAHSGAAETYAIIKRELIRLNPDDVDAYYAVKDPVCDLIMDSARLWAAATCWEPGHSDA